MSVLARLAVCSAQRIAVAVTGLAALAGPVRLRLPYGIELIETADGRWLVKGGGWPVDASTLAWALECADFLIGEATP